MLKVRAIVVTVVASLVAASAAQAASPRVVPDWPVVSAAGLVLPGPGGGPVVVSEGFGAHEAPLSAVAAFRLDGRRRWLSASLWGCGNCSLGQDPPVLHPDGRYGPIGPNPHAWAIDQSGVRVDSCGIALADGTCVTHTERISPDPQGFRVFPALLARRAGSALWEYSNPQFPWTISHELDLHPPRIVQDGASGLYTAFGPVRSSSPPLPAELLALDRRTGALRWRTSGAVPRAGLTSGVIATHTTAGLVAYDATGVVRWATAVRPTEVVVAVIADEPRDRVYLQLARTDSRRPRISALDATTGTERWSTAVADRARLLSVGANGHVYAAIDRPGRPGLRAIGPEGRSRWQFDTTTAVGGAQRLPDGTVALTTSGAGSSAEGGLLWRIDSRATRLSARSLRFSLSRTTFATGCATPDCEYRRGVGTVLRIASPVTGTARIRILRPDGTPVSSTSTTLHVPAGVSHTRLLAGGYSPAAASGAVRRVIELRGRFEGQVRVVRFPVVLRR